jgi:hypothetical protein
MLMAGTIAPGAARGVGDLPYFEPRVAQTYGYLFGLTDRHPSLDGGPTLP